MYLYSIVQFSRFDQLLFSFYPICPASSSRAPDSQPSITKITSNVKSNASTNLPILLFIPFNSHQINVNKRKYRNSAISGTNDKIDLPCATSNKALINPSTTAINFSGLSNCLKAYLTPII